EIELDKQKKHTIEVVVDRLVIRRGQGRNVGEPIDSQPANETASLPAVRQAARNELRPYKKVAERPALYDVNADRDEMDGVGAQFIAPENTPEPVEEVDAELIVTHPELSLLEGAIAPWSKVVNGSQWHAAILDALAKKYQFSLHTPWRDLTEEQRKAVLYGTSEPLTIRYTPQHGGTRSYTINFEGVIPNLDRRYKQTD